MQQQDGLPFLLIPLDRCFIHDLPPADELILFFILKK
jgi:hypothetical protein